MAKKKIKTDHFDDRVVLENIRQLADKERATDISRRFKNLGISVSREAVVPLVGEAIDRDMVVLMAPPQKTLSRGLSSAYGRGFREIRVINAPDASSREYVCRDAAKLIVELIREVQAKRTKRQKRKPVHIGLGGGHTVRQVMIELARMLKSEVLLPDLVLHVISSGFEVERPNSAPITFLAFFEGIPTHVSSYGLFAPAVVNTRDYARVKRLPGVEESFAARDKIDIYITSIASAKDRDGALNRFAAAHRNRGFKLSALKRAKWIGDLQYMAYSEEGPIKVDIGKRSVTLFELPDLRKRVENEGTRVVVVAPPCASCNRRKTDALEPLLERDELAVWTHMVIDLQTAQELMPATA